MAHAWNEPYRDLYNRTYRVLYDAGIDEKLADELATQRTLTVALKQREQLRAKAQPAQEFAIPNGARSNSAAGH